ncbi:WD domain-containing protein [Sclerotinia borealis F-4128]|uniref:WD domain-containing protein n=1 Tax=Sclerotinia borealis (strain F-4128) TaxID=1432307 RepID=W9C1I2_SCLBF|nr:WD domain-containing protein [Sclerotinia borealis F-4128]
MASRRNVPGAFPLDNSMAGNASGEDDEVISEDEDDEDEDEDFEEDIDDDDENEAGFEVQLEMEDDENEGATAADHSETYTSFTLLQTIWLILRLSLARRTQNLLRMLAAHPDVRNIIRFSADIDEDELIGWPRRRRRSPPDPNRFPKVPSIAGAELMASGDFGSNYAQSSGTDNQVKARKRLARRILDREIASGNFANQRINRRIIAQEMLPSSNADTIINHDEPVYSGQFSDDGNFFFAVTKDFKVRMYDTSNPYKWTYYKTVVYPFGQWTLTDASLSPDNKYLAYSSIRSTVCLAPTDPNDLGDPYNLDLADTMNGRNPNLAIGERRGSFGIWSIRFSGDGRQLVAGTTGGSIVVYDIESRRTLFRIFGHEEDVNAVCFADKLSPHILYSGSDDATIKVWDTRSMGDSREAGAFIGHIEGLTYLDSKGDGRYILSNGKDQSMKLWDLRMVMSSAKFSHIRSNGRRPGTGFDYRWGAYDEDDWYHDKNDNSLVTFRGHKVMRTLIRCHFSPPGSTNSRYVYSGSEDGKVYIWNMDATLAGKVDVLQATEGTRPPPENQWHGGWHDNLDEVDYSRWETVVRDASWHPTAPMIAASAWNGHGTEQGTVTTHSWNEGAEDDEAEPKMGLRVNAKLEHDPRLYESRTRSSARLRHAGGLLTDPEDSDNYDDE